MNDQELESEGVGVAPDEADQTSAVRAYLAALERTGRPGVELEAAFIAVISGYAQQHGILYATWREIGVPARVLRLGGIHPD